jgi:hypothetical protein
MESAKNRPADDGAVPPSLSHDRILHHQAAVGSVMVVVVDELVQKLPKMALAQHHDVVETFLLMPKGEVLQNEVAARAERCS